MLKMDKYCLLSFITILVFLNGSHSIEEPDEIVTSSTITSNNNSSISTPSQQNTDGTINTSTDDVVSDNVTKVSLNEAQHETKASGIDDRSVTEYPVTEIPHKTEVIIQVGLQVNPRTRLESGSSPQPSDISRTTSRPLSTTDMFRTTSMPLSTTDMSRTTSRPLSTTDMSRTTSRPLSTTDIPTTQNATVVLRLEPFTNSHTSSDIFHDNITSHIDNVAESSDEVVKLLPNIHDGQAPSENTSTVLVKRPRFNTKEESFENILGETANESFTYISTEESNSVATAETTARKTIASQSGGGRETSKNITTMKYITLLLQKNCTGRSIFHNTLSVLNTHMLGLLNKGENANVNINLKDCHTFLHLKFAVNSANDDIIRTATKILSANITLGSDYKILKAYQSDEDFETTDLETTLTSGVSDTFEIRQHGEIIAYVIAAFSCLFVLILFATLCCIRCASNKQANSLDLCDIPHLNLKLEDYKIMPIPRPSISYQDYGRELLSSTYGESRSGDTFASHHKFAVDASSSLGNTLHRETILARQELRTFNDNKHCTRVQSLDMRPNRNVSSWVNNSREKLNADLERRRLSGIDNGTFEKW